MQTTNDFRVLRPTAGRPFEFDLFLADAMRFVPMEFRSNDRTIVKPNDRGPFHLPPRCSSVIAVQPAESPDASSDRDRFDVADLSQDFELHRHRGSLGGRWRPSFLPRVEAGCLIAADAASYWAQPTRR